MLVKNEAGRGIHVPSEGQFLEHIARGSLTKEVGLLSALHCNCLYGAGWVKSRCLLEAKFGRHV